MLGNRRTRYRQVPRKFVYSRWPALQFLEDRHARRVRQGIQSGL
jgi:hypothetical protein